MADEDTVPRARLNEKIAELTEARASTDALTAQLAAIDVGAFESTIAGLQGELSTLHNGGALKALGLDPAGEEAEYALHRYGKTEGEKDRPAFSDWLPGFADTSTIVKNGIIAAQDAAAAEVQRLADEAATPELDEHGKPKPKPAPKPKPRATPKRKPAASQVPPGDGSNVLTPEEVRDLGHAAYAKRRVALRS